MLKGYKYRLHPTAAQAKFLVKTIGCARFIYNKLLEDRITIREEAKRCMDLGTHAVVVGGAITRPQQITARFEEAMSSSVTPK